MFFSIKQDEDGFTLIELIVVMAVIAVLVLLAAPRFLGYTKDAGVTAMKQDIKVLSDAAEVYHLNNEEWPIVKGEGPVHLGYGGGSTLYRLDEEKITESIKGISASYKDYGIVTDGIYKGKVFHLSGVENKDGGLDYGNQIERFEAPVYNSKKEWEAVLESSPENYYYATSDDFDYVDDEEAPGGGYYKYTNKERYVVVPDEINGIPITSYYGMFKGTNVNGVASYSKNITDMGSMFYEVNTDVLDLELLSTDSVNNMKSMFTRATIGELKTSNFNTSNVENMWYMFSWTNIQHMDISNFDTSNVTNMRTMFRGTEMKSLDLSTFDTSKVTSMAGMFNGSAIEYVNLSNFDTKNIEEIFSMFNDTVIEEVDLSSFDLTNAIQYQNMFRSSELKTIYVRNQVELDRLSTLPANPKGVVFKIKD